MSTLSKKKIEEVKMKYNTNTKLPS